MDKQTKREKELEDMLARVGRVLYSMKPFVCMNTECEHRKTAKICPHCGQIIEP